MDLQKVLVIHLQNLLVLLVKKLTLKALFLHPPLVSSIDGLRRVAERDRALEALAAPRHAGGEVRQRPGAAGGRHLPLAAGGLQPGHEAHGEVLRRGFRAPQLRGHAGPLAGRRVLRRGGAAGAQGAGAQGHGDALLVGPSELPGAVYMPLPMRFQAVQVPSEA